LRTAPRFGVPRLGADGGEDDDRNAAYDPGEAAPAAGELADELVEVVCRQAEKGHPHLRGRNGAHRSMERVGIVEGPAWHSVILAETERKQAGIRNFAS
jgi:hypothetical protein